jgi:L-serine deaminase
VAAQGNDAGADSNSSQRFDSLTAGKVKLLAAAMVRPSLRNGGGMVTAPGGGSAGARRAQSRQTMVWQVSTRTVSSSVMVNGAWLGMEGTARIWFRRAVGMVGVTGVVMGMTQCRRAL